MGDFGPLERIRSSLSGDAPQGRPIANIAKPDPSLDAIFASLEYFLPYPFVPQTVVVSLAFMGWNINGAQHRARMEPGMAAWERMELVSN